LENCIWEQPWVSLQVKVKATPVLLVEAAPELMVTVPVGATLSMV
jgi:hypothetical protein